MSDLAIRKFAEHQHYKNRPGMPWVKFYVELLDDEKFNALSATTRLVGCLLLLVAQRRGNRIPASAGWLEAEVHVPRAKAQQALDELIELRFLVPSSELSSDPSSESSRADPEEASSDSSSPPARPRTRREEKRREEREEANASSSEQSPKKARKPDALWDTLEREIGPAETKSERGRRNKALAELREVGATPGELVVRIGRYHRRWPDIDLTATALAANWSTLSTAGSNGSSTFRPESEEEREQRIVRELAARGPRP